MSSRATIIAGPLLLVSGNAWAQSGHQPSARELVAQARQYGRASGCEPGDRNANGDIVVCGRRNENGLPIPEIAGPALEQTDGAAVRPDGPPCGASGGRNECFEGIDVRAAVGAAIAGIQSLIDPDRNLGTGTPIPRRFRGANR